MNCNYKKTIRCASLPVYLLFALLPFSTAQIPIEWDASLGGNIWEELNSVEQLPDGGFIMAGYSSSSQNGDVSGLTNGGGDYWVVRTNSLGQIQWENNFGGDQLERPWQILPTNDGGYLVAGYSSSNSSGDKSENSRGADDYWVVKMDASGNYQWDRTYGGDNLDFCYDVIQLNDGGFLLAGRSLSGISGEKTEANIGNWDVWLVKIDAAGNLLWEETIGGADEDLISEMQLAPDGHVWLAGGTSSSLSADVTSASLGGKDFWLFKVNSTNGTVMWQNRYGGTDEDEIFSFVQTADGGFLLGGGSRSNANPPFKSEDNFGIVDIWVVKTNAAGVKLWDKNFGGDGLDNCYSVRENSANNYIVSGFSNSVMTGNKTTGTNGGYDYWLIYLDDIGNKLWEASIGGADNDVLQNAFQANDGGYLLAGHSSSNVSGDKMDPSNGFNDFWVVKTLCDVMVDMPNEAICPGETATLDAFTGVNCLGCAYTWGDNPTNDSIRIVAPLASTTYNLTLTDGFGCTATDAVTITVLPTNFNDNLDDALALCNGQSATLNAGNFGSTYQWSTGATTQIINVTTANTYLVTITANNGCTYVDSTVVSVIGAIAVDLGADASICANTGSALVNAGNPGMNYLWSPGGQTTQFIAVSVAGTYAVTVSDASGSCSDSDEIVISEYDSPSVTSSMVACNDSNTFYTVTLLISGGDVNTYTMSGTGGTFSGSTFTSVPIPKDQPYTFFVSDAAGCTPLPTGGVYDCDCMSDGGVLTPTAVTVCGESTVEITTITAPTADANDIIQYAVHENPVLDNNTIVYFANSPTITFQVGMNYGQTYYVTALAGNEIPTGSVLLEDGCLGLSNSVPLTFYQSPIAQAVSQSSQEISCMMPAVVLDGSASSVPGGGFIFYSWEALDGGNITGNTNAVTVEANAAGNYVLTVSNSAGCTATDTLALTSNGMLPFVTIATPTLLNCVDSLVTIDASNSDSGPNYTISWAGSGMAGVTSLTPTVMNPGVYGLTITDNTNGCSASQSITILANYDTPVANVDPVYYMNCTTGMVTMEAAAFPPEPDYQIQWTTADGEILSGQNEFTAVGGLEGVYVVEITNTVSGCSDAISTTILPNEFRPRSAWLKYGRPLCLGGMDGWMRVDSILGGIAPFEYSFNDEPFTTDTFNLQLSAGENTILIKDVNGCTWDTTVILNDGREMLVDFENIYGQVDLGDSIQLEAVGSLDVAEMVWDSPIPLSCYDCLAPYITPTLDSVTIAVQLFSEDGCTNRDEITVYVKKNRLVYIPNAFSPNGNRRNDFFSVFTGKGVSAIRFLRVYNRWGGQIYEAKNLTLGDKRNGWDGLQENEEPALPGVYVYVVEVEFLDGEVRQYRGDFTLFK